MAVTATPAQFDPKDVRNVEWKSFSHEEAQTAIYNAKFRAIQQLIDIVDQSLSSLEVQYYAHQSPTEHQVVAYFAAHNQLLRFKGDLQKQQHTAFMDYQHALKFPGASQ